MELNSGIDFFTTKPPLLEDAGLEDPALLPDAIQEAFRLAAEKVKSTASGILDRIDTSKRFGGCIEGVFPEGQLDDALVDPIEENRQGSCTDMHAGGLVEDGHDVVIDYEGHGDDILIGAKDSNLQDDGRSCIVDGLIADVAGEGSDKNNGCSDEDAPKLTVV